MKESKFQSNLIKKIKEMFDDCIVLKNDANYLQGFPDILILYKDKWAVLENKKSSTASHRPNQDHYINLTNMMSFGRFIFPENEKEVLDELQQTFRS